MHTNPKENRTQVDHILLDQFRRKGYKCEEIEENDATVFIIKHEKKTNDVIGQSIVEPYRGLFKAN